MIKYNKNDVVGNCIFIEEAGYKDAKEFLNSGMKRLQTESGKKIGAELYFADPNAWWKEFQPSSKFAETVGL